MFQGTLILACACYQKSHNILDLTDRFSPGPAWLRGVEVLRGLGQLGELDVFVFAKCLPRQLERCVGALSNSGAILEAAQGGALTYGMNVTLLKPRAAVLKNCLPPSVTAPNAVSLLRPPTCGTLTGIPTGNQCLRPAESLCMKNAPSIAATANPALFRRAMRLFVRWRQEFTVPPPAWLTSTLAAVLARVRPRTRAFRHTLCRAGSSPPAIFFAGAPRVRSLPAPPPTVYYPSSRRRSLEASTPGRSRRASIPHSSDRLAHIRTQFVHCVSASAARCAPSCCNAPCLPRPSSRPPLDPFLFDTCAGLFLGHLSHAACQII